jgi:hypothetical protein
MSYPDWYPGAVQVPGSRANAYPSRHGYVPEAVVLHIMEGSLAGCDSWFANPNAGAGAHFGIGKNGIVHQYYPLHMAPFANGVIEPGYSAKLIDANGGANPNYWTVSIEHEGFSGDPVPQAQYDASVALSIWLFLYVFYPGGATHVTVDRQHILQHADISPLSRIGCPGWTEPYMATYINEVSTTIEAATEDA